MVIATRKKKGKENVSVTRDTPKNKKRFKAPLEEGSMKQLMETHILANTRRNTTWVLACKLLGDWIAERNVNTTSSKLCPVNLLKCDHTVINYWLCRFVGETRKKHGEP